MEIVQIEINQIKTAEYNPPSRTDGKSVSELKESIRRVGIIYPVLITQNMELIDGHRRLECARLLGMKTVPALIVDMPRDETFVEVNTNTKKLTSGDGLFVYLCGGPLNGRIAADIKLLEYYIGRDGLEILSDRGGSAKGTNQVATMLLNYISMNEPSYITGKNAYGRQLVLWMIKMRQTFRVRMAIAAKLSPAVILACIEANEPLPI